MQNSLESVDEVENLFDRLFPIMRSIMGNGYRESLNILKEYHTQDLSNLLKIKGIY